MYQYHCNALTANDAVAVVHDHWLSAKLSSSYSLIRPQAKLIQFKVISIFVIVLQSASNQENELSRLRQQMEKLHIGTDTKVDK